MDMELGKEYVKAVYCHPAYLYAEYIMWNTGLEEAQAGNETARKNTNNLKCADDVTLTAENKLKVTQSCLTLWDPMEYTVHGILQAVFWSGLPFPSPVNLLLLHWLH